MKTRFFLGFLIPFLLVSCLVTAASKKKADKDTKQWRYEIETVGSAVQGTAQVKVWSYSKNQNTAIDQAKKNAVHGVIFKGTPDNGRIRGQRALTQDPNVEVEQGEFFNAFFEDGGKYLKFVSLVNNGAIAPGDRVKVGKEYKIGITVQVNTLSLRKELEDAGVIRSLGSGF